jgi:hypothetical protein
MQVEKAEKLGLGIFVSKRRSSPSCSNSVVTGRRESQIQGSTQLSNLCIIAVTKDTLGTLIVLDQADDICERVSNHSCPPCDRPHPI